LEEESMGKVWKSPTLKCKKWKKKEKIASIKAPPHEERRGKSDSRRKSSGGRNKGEGGGKTAVEGSTSAQAFERGGEKTLGERE